MPEALIKKFHRKGFFHWDKLISDWHGPIPLWKEAENMGMLDSLSQIWRNIRVSLRSSDIFHSSEADFLIWRFSKGINLIRVKDIYQNMISLKDALPNPVFPSVFWKTGCPPKMTYFSWLTFHNKKLSWENLKKRGWSGPSLCLFCKAAEESNCHMFWSYQRTQILWQSLEKIYGIPHVPHSSTKEAFLWWSGQKESWRPLIIITLWNIQRWRNNVIFNNKIEPFLEILTHIVSLYDSLLEKPFRQKRDDPKEQT